MAEANGENSENVGSAPWLRDQNCELRHELINMIERMQFRGLSRLCSSSEEIPKAHRHNEDPNYSSEQRQIGFLSVLTSRKDWRLALWPTKPEHYHLRPVFNIVHVENSSKLIREIGNFAQYEEESLSKALEWFKGLHKSFPHHGY